MAGEWETVEYWKARWRLEFRDGADQAVLLNRYREALEDIADPFKHPGGDAKAITAEIALGRLDENGYPVDSVTNESHEDR